MSHSHNISSSISTLGPRAHSPNLIYIVSSDPQIVDLQTLTSRCLDQGRDSQFIKHSRLPWTVNTSKARQVFWFNDPRQRSSYCMLGKSILSARCDSIITSIRENRLDLSSASPSRCMRSLRQWLTKVISMSIFWCLLGSLQCKHRAI